MTPEKNREVLLRSRSMKLIVAFIVLGTGLVYFFSNPRPQAHYDYTFRVAERFFHGEVGFDTRQAPWLNEMVPFEGRYYTVFPYGSVLSMMPFAFFKFIGLTETMPAALIGGLLAALICLLLFLVSRYYEHTLRKRVLLVLGIMFGTWLWTNLMMAGAWHLALGFAMAGELGAIYFTVFRRSPVLAGACFALAFGNRTEILLTAPVFLYMLAGEPVRRISEEAAALDGNEPPPRGPLALDLLGFCLVPFLLGVSTLVYNHIRFGSPFDFGYSRIPGVLEEPWYRHGIFSIWYVPYNVKEMLLMPWRRIGEFPYLVPTGFGGSVFLASPFLIFVFARRYRHEILKYVCWTAILLLTFVLWIHGNAGGWQYSYRYAIILLPWIFLILLETRPPQRITAAEWITYSFSFIINLYATYLFFWTDHVRP